MPKKRKARKKHVKLPPVRVPVPAEEVHLAVILPEPVTGAPAVTWQAKGKRLLIKIRDFVAPALVLVLMVPLVGACSLAPSDDVLRELVKNERSWCLIVNTVYGTARIAGTGIRNGSVVCSQEGMVVKSDAPPAPPLGPPAR